MKQNVLFGFTLLRNSFLAEYTYRWQVFSKILYGTLLYVTQLCIWRSINISAPNEIYNLETMSIYVMLSSLIGVFISFDGNFIPVIGNRIRSGDIALDLVKPYSLFYLLFCQYLGRCAFKLLFHFLPQFVLILVISRINISVPFLNVILFAGSVVLAILLFFSLSMVLGVISFWIVSVGNLHVFLDSSITLFGGTIIPIWMIPTQIRWLYEILPFQYLFYKPICIFLNQVNNVGDILYIYIVQICWIIALLFLAIRLYHLGVRKLLIFGV